MYNRVLVEVQLYKNHRDNVIKICYDIGRSGWIPEEFREKDIEEIVLGNVVERDKTREAYLTNELEIKLNEAISN